MRAVWLVARARLRANRASTAALLLLVAVTVAVALAALAGARRTDRAFANFVAQDRGSDLFAAFTPMALGGPASPDLGPEAARIRTVPGVREAHRATNTIVAAQDDSVPSGERRLLGWLAMEPDGLRGLANPHVLAGRLPDDGAVDEVAIDEELARDAGLRVGDRYRVRVFTAEQSGATTDFGVAPAGAAADATVVGIVRRPTDLRDLDAPKGSQSAYLTHHELYLTAAFWATTGSDVAVLNPLVGVTVEPGSDVDVVSQAISDAFDGEVFTISDHDFRDEQGTFTGVRRLVSLQSRALQTFAAIAAIVGLFVVAQTAGRQLALEAVDTPTLRAMGMTGRDTRRASLVRAAPFALGGTALGMPLAVALSPLAPLPHSIPRRAELSPGLHVDWTVLLLGAAVAPVVILLLSVHLARRGGAPAAPRRHARPTIAARLGVAGGSPPAVVGVRFALEPGHGPRAVPVRTAMLTGALALAVVLGTVVFTASLDATEDHPTRHGSTWDFSAGYFLDNGSADAAAAQLAQVPGLAAFSGAATTTSPVNGRPTDLLFLRADRGRVGPTVLEGRLPGEGEIALGRATLAALHTRIGGTVEIEVAPGAPPVPFAVVGSMVMNTAGLSSAVAPDEGGVLDWSAAAALFGAQAEFFTPQAFLIRIAPDADQATAEGQLEQLFPDSATPPIEPADLANLRDVRSMPVALGVVVTVLGAGAVAHALLSAVRRRRHDLAVLKALGFTKGNAGASITYQALTFAAIATAVGVPVGIIAGRLAWSTAADQVGIINQLEVPALAVVAAVVALLVLLLVIAVVPGRLAGQVPAAEVLRSDAVV